MTTHANNQIPSSQLALTGLKAFILANLFLALWLLPRASLESLQFLLFPVATLLELLLGYDFTFVAGQGYVDPYADILIAAECAGVRFFVIASLIALFTQREASSLGNAFGQSVLGLLSAYLLTIASNTARITLLLTPDAMPADIQFTLSRLPHEVLSSLTYFSFLTAFVIFRRHYR